jgi:hypothetical protein
MNHYNIQFNYHETKCDETFDLVVDLFVTWPYLWPDLVSKNNPISDET